MALRRTVSKLPVVLQTDAQREFFAATFDQLFSPRNVEDADGFIGRKSGGVLNAPYDNYIAEPTKNRAAYQLEPIAYSTDPNTLEQTNEVFYEDLVNYIRFRGGNTGNHDRLFGGEYYSFAPPIDMDKFLNFQNYVWLEDNIPIIYITCDSPSSAQFDLIIENQIIGKPAFNTSQEPTLQPYNLQLSSGMRVRFEGSDKYDEPLYVESVGRGIRLVKDRTIILSTGSTTFIPWDSGTGIQWDAQQWDATTEADLTQKDYITMERGSCDANPWSRTNRWFHADVIARTQEVGQILSATINDGGIGYNVGDILIPQGNGTGAEITVASTDIFGTILSVRVSRRGQGYSIATINEVGAVPLPGYIPWDASPSSNGTVWDTFIWCPM